MNRQRSALAREKETFQAELVRVTKQIDKLVEAIIRGCGRAGGEREAKGT